MAVLIGGLSGTGESTMCQELTHRGYRAVDADAEFAYFGDPATGRPTDVRTRANWIWDVAKLRDFCDRSPDAPMFICGGALNQDACADLFTHRIELRIDDETMRHRLLSRTNNDFGKDPLELAEQLELNRDINRNPGWIIIDATRPIGGVADDILRSVLSPGVR